MGYQQRARAPRNLGRGREKPRREKAKAKVQKRRSSGSLAPQEDHVPTPEEAVNRTHNTLHTLGNQRFGLPPFSEHLGRWLVNLKAVLSEFESSPNITVDDQFTKERSQILSNIEAHLEKKRLNEAHSGETTKNLSDNRILLERIEQDYTAATKETQRQKDAETKRLSGNIEGIKEELDRIARMKTGIFRAISKNTKAQKEIEANRRLKTVQSELASVMQHFTDEQKKLQDEHEKRKQAIIKQIQHDEKEIENQEIDDSLETRQEACEALVNVVNSLLQRKKFSHN
jgi:hypothetical protein